MKKRLKVYGFVALTLGAASLVIKYGYADLSALAWHIRHGSHVNGGGVRVPVPISFEASDPAGLPSVLITRSRGLLWHEGGLIDIDFRRMPSPEDEEVLVALLPKSSSTIKRTKIGERAATFAGRQGKCVEYNTQLIAPGLVIKSYEIYCRFNGDVSARFMGSPKIKDNFYNIIQTAEPLGAKE
ncbi:MAG TPA: hypothetical protein VIK39_07240 [Candidatus Angelobacter sp.]